MTGGGAKWSKMTGFFTPEHNRDFAANLGPLKFRKANGKLATGDYGKGYAMIQITNSYWRPSPSQEQEVHGTFRNREGRTGNFIFNFESACTFQDEWWY